MKIALMVAILLIFAACTPAIVQPQEINPPENKNVATNSPDTENVAVSNDEDNEIAPSQEIPNIEATSISYLDYSEAAYKQALEEEKVIYLEFWAIWCPICVKMDPDIKAAFRSLNSDNIVPRDIIGFKVDFDTQEDLKREFNVISQHTHIILGRDGEVATRSLSTWSENQIKTEILKVAEI